LNDQLQETIVTKGTRWSGGYVGIILSKARRAAEHIGSKRECPLDDRTPSAEVLIETVGCFEHARRVLKGNWIPGRYILIEGRAVERIAHVSNRFYIPGRNILVERRRCEHLCHGFDVGDVPIIKWKIIKTSTIEHQAHVTSGRDIPSIERLIKHTAQEHRIEVGDSAHIKV
jgi:hypothetical protein